MQPWEGSSAAAALTGDDEVERGAPSTTLGTETDSAHFLTPTGVQALLDTLALNTL